MHPRSLRCTCPSQRHPSVPDVRCRFGSVVATNGHFAGGRRSEGPDWGQNANPTDKVESHSDSGERHRHPRRTRRGNRSRTDSDRNGGAHEYRGNHHLNDTPGGASNCHCKPDLEGTATPRLLTPTGRLSPETSTPPR